MGWFQAHFYCPGLFEIGVAHVPYMPQGNSYSKAKGSTEDRSSRLPNVERGHQHRRTLQKPKDGNMYVLIASGFSFPWLCTPIAVAQNWWIRDFVGRPELSDCCTEWTLCVTKARVRIYHIC